MRKIVVALAVLLATLTTVTPAFAAAPIRCEKYRATAISAGWPRSQVNKVLRTMYRESACKPLVRGSRHETGLMQIADIVLHDARFKKAFPHFNRLELYVPWVNLRVAHWLWTVDGWGPWNGGA